MFTFYRIENKPTEPEPEAPKENGVPKPESMAAENTSITVNKTHF